MINLNTPMETLIREVHALDHASCISELRQMPHLKLDFTDEFLRNLSLERVRHILMAAILQARRRHGVVRTRSRYGRHTLQAADRPRHKSA